MALAAQALEAQKAWKPLEQGGALEQVAARIERVMGLTAKVSRPPKAGRLDCTVRPRRQNGKPQLDDGRELRKRTAPRRRRNACKMIADSAYCTSAGGQKGLKLALHPKAKPGTRQKTQRITA